jgi:hypothetical protein
MLSAVFDRARINGDEGVRRDPFSYPFSQKEALYARRS